MSEVFRNVPLIVTEFEISEWKSNLELRTLTALELTRFKRETLLAVAGFSKTLSQICSKKNDRNTAPFITSPFVDIFLIV